MAAFSWHRLANHFTRGWCQENVVQSVGHSHGCGMWIIKSAVMQRHSLCTANCIMMTYMCSTDGEVFQPNNLKVYLHHTGRVFVNYLSSFSHYSRSHFEQFWYRFSQKLKLTTERWFCCALKNIIFRWLKRERDWARVSISDDAGKIWKAYIDRSTLEVHNRKI